jgi:MFS family permease
LIIIELVEVVIDMSTEKNAVLCNSNIGLNARALSVWFIVSLFTCFQFCTQVIAGPMTSELMETYGLNAVTVSYAVSSFFYIYLAMQLPAGLMLDRYSNRFVLSVTCLICALGCILMGKADNIYAFVLARMLCGFGAAFGFIGAMRVLRNYFSLKYIALLIGFTEMLGFFVTALCENLVSYFLPIIGFKQVFIYLGMIGLGVAGSIYIVMHGKFAPDYQLAPAVKNNNLWLDLSELLKNKQIWILGVISFSFFSLVTAFAALWGVPALVNIHKMSLSQGAQIISIIFIGIAIGGPIIGYIGSKITNYNQFMYWCGVICASLMLVFTVCDNLSYMSLSIILFFCSLVSCCYLLCFTIANTITPSRLSGSSMGLLNMITMVSALLMQPLMGYLISFNGAVDFINGAPIYEQAGYQRACIILIMAFLLASFLSTRLNIKEAIKAAKATY